jgi:hypothetical protein
MLRWGGGTNTIKASFGQYLADNNKLRLISLDGKFFLSTGTELTKAKVTLYRQTAMPGYYETTSTLTYQSPNPANGDAITGPFAVQNQMMIKSWDVIWTPPLGSAPVFTKNSRIRIGVVLTIKQGAYTMDVSPADLFVDVE